MIFEKLHELLKADAYKTQRYWSAIGIEQHVPSLIDMHGEIEPTPAGGSIIPILTTAHETLPLSWRDFPVIEQSLADGFLPIPSVTWGGRDDVSLAITSFVGGTPKKPVLLARFIATNIGNEPINGTLHLVYTPFKVNPPWQNLASPGGIVAIRSAVSMRRNRNVIEVRTPDGSDEYIYAMTPGSALSQKRIEQQYDYASIDYPLSLNATETKRVYLGIPLSPRAIDAYEYRETLWQTEEKRVSAHWRHTLERTEIRIPNQQIAEAIKTAVGHLLINTEGDAFIPGPRAYRTTWIRDSALIAEALLSMGIAEPAVRFLRWYTGLQRKSGSFPCGKGPAITPGVIEHDSNGTWLYLVASVHRFTGDDELVSQLWPQIKKAASYLDRLRLTTRAPLYKKTFEYGIVPRSASHEGYINIEGYAYAVWDNIWTLIGFKSAAYLARALGNTLDAELLGATADQFRSDFYAAIERSMTLHGIEYIPGALDLGDEDFPAIAALVSPGDELAHLPLEAFECTRDRHFAYVQKRRADTTRKPPYDRYAPYEMRTIGALIRMGFAERAYDLLIHYLADQRPPQWRLWAEVVWRDQHRSEYIGDMPHSWIAAEFIRSVRSFFAFEEEDTLVVGAGMSGSFLGEGGVDVKRLPTHFGKLDLSITTEGQYLTAHVGGEIHAPGGVFLRIPRGKQKLRQVLVNGTRVHPTMRGIRLPSLPARVFIHR